jgi:hypothetical protein
MPPCSASSLQADHQLALLQHGTRLYLVNMAAISRDLFYQLLLTRWEALPVMQLAQPLHVGTLVELALTLEEAAGRWQVGQFSCWVPGWLASSSAATQHHACARLTLLLWR